MLAQVKELWILDSTCRIEVEQIGHRTVPCDALIQPESATFLLLANVGLQRWLRDYQKRRQLIHASVCWPRKPWKAHKAIRDDLARGVAVPCILRSRPAMDSDCHIRQGESSIDQTPSCKCEQWKAGYKEQATYTTILLLLNKYTII